MEIKSAADAPILPPAEASAPRTETSAPAVVENSSGTRLDSPPAGGNQINFLA